MDGFNCGQQANLFPLSPRLVVTTSWPYLYCNKGHLTMTVRQSFSLEYFHVMVFFPQKCKLEFELETGSNLNNKTLKFTP